MIYGILIILSCIAVAIIVGYLHSRKRAIEAECRDEIILEKNKIIEKKNTELLQEAKKSSLVKENSVEAQEKETKETIEPIEKKGGLKEKGAREEIESIGVVFENIEMETASIQEEVEERDERFPEEDGEACLPGDEISDSFEDTTPREEENMSLEANQINFKEPMEVKKERFIKITEQDIGERICHFNYGEGIVHSIVKDHYVRIDFIDTGTVLFPMGLSQNGGVMKLIRLEE